MNKSNPRTVLKKNVLVSYTLSMIVFSCIVMGFSKDLAIIYCSATLASVCTFFYKKHRTVNWILLSFALMSTYTLFIRVKTFTTIKEIMIPSLAICGLSFIIMWCSCCLKKILRKRQHWKCSFEKVSSYGSLSCTLERHLFGVHTKKSKNKWS